MRNAQCAMPNAQCPQLIIKTANTTLVLRFTPIPESINSHTLVQCASELIHEPTEYKYIFKFNRPKPGSGNPL
jgi:hypothetical protein